MSNSNLEQARANYYKAVAKRTKAVKKGCGEYAAMKLQAKVVRCARKFDEIAMKSDDHNTRFNLTFFGE